MSRSAQDALSAMTVRKRESAARSSWNRGSATEYDSPGTSKVQPTGSASYSQPRLARLTTTRYRTSEPSDVEDGVQTASPPSNRRSRGCDGRCSSAQPSTGVVDASSAVQPKLASAAHSAGVPRLREY